MTIFGTWDVYLWPYGYLLLPKSGGCAEKGQEGGQGARLLSGRHCPARRAARFRDLSGGEGDCAVYREAERLSGDPPFILQMRLDRRQDGRLNLG